MKTQYTMKDIREIAKAYGEKIVKVKAIVNGQQTYRIFYSYGYKSGFDGYPASQSLFTKTGLIKRYYEF